MRFGYFFTLILMLTMVSCTAATPQVAPSAIQPSTTTFPYPAPILETSAPAYPALAYPAPPEETEEPTPTADPTLGVVKGELYLKGEPVNKALLFLSDVFKDNQGNDSVVSIDFNTKNRAITKQDGSFTFVNIPQKHYALVLVVMPNSFVLLDPKTQASMIVDVKAGEIVSIGKLDYDDLPIP